MAEIELSKSELDFSRSIIRSLEYYLSTWEVKTNADGELFLYKKINDFAITVMPSPEVDKLCYIGVYVEKIKFLLFKKQLLAKCFCCDETLYNDILEKIDKHINRYSSDAMLDKISGSLLGGY